MWLIVCWFSVKAKYRINVSHETNVQILKNEYLKKNKVDKFFLLCFCLHFFVLQLILPMSCISQNELVDTSLVCVISLDKMVGHQDYFLIFSLDDKNSCFKNS